MRKRVTKKVCDRCPIGHEQLATRTVAFSLGDTHWLIDVCEWHGSELDRTIGMWGRLGREDTHHGPVTFTSDYAAEARRAAELRSAQVAQERAKALPEPDKPVNHSAVSHSPIPKTRDAHGPWRWTDHARERLQEREVDIVAALWTVVEPETIRPARTPGNEVRIRDGIQVVVDPRSRAILTVAHHTTEGSNHGNQDVAHHHAG